MTAIHDCNGFMHVEKVLCNILEHMCCMLVTVYGLHLHLQGWSE